LPEQRHGADVVWAVVVSNGEDLCFLLGNAGDVVLGYDCLFAGAKGFTRSVKVHSVGGLGASDLA
jgi:hypothetical protein